MRLVPSVVLVALAACGGSSKPATTPPPTGDGTPAAAGTTGLPGLDWGATAEAVTALYPRATPSDDGVTALGMVDGRNAITVFTIGASGLERVHTEWTDGFISMEDCSGGWSDERGKLDARLGPSTADNLAAYWDTATATITLVCDPNDSGAGVLSLIYAPRTDE